VFTRGRCDGHSRSVALVVTGCEAGTVVVVAGATRWLNQVEPADAMTSVSI